MTKVRGMKYGRCMPSETSKYSFLIPCDTPAITYIVDCQSSKVRTSSRQIYIKARDSVGLYEMLHTRVESYRFVN